MAQTATVLQIPDELKPADGRFGSGPSRVRPEQLEHLAQAGAAVMGTSHRQKPVKQLVGAIRAGPARAVRRCPTATRSRSATAARRRSGTPPTCCLVRERALHLALRRVLLEVRRLHARRAVPGATRSSIEAPARRRARAGRLDPARRRDRLGAQRDLDRRDGPGRCARPAPDDALVLIDATSGARRPAGRRRPGRRLLLRAAEGVRLRRRAVAGAAEPGGARRGSSEIAAAAAGRALDPRLPVAERPRSRTRVKDQTYNTPAIATLFLLADQLDWMLEQGGLEAMVARTTESSTAPVRLGRGAPARDAVRRRPGQALAGRRDDRLRRGGRRGRAGGDAARQRDRRRRAVPQARPQPAADRDVPRHRSRRRAGADRCIDWVLERLMNPRCQGARRREDRRLRDRAAAASTSTSTSASAGTASSWPSGSATTTGS